MNSYKNLKLQLEQGILTVALNRPQTMNAISPELMDDLFALTEQLENDRDARVVIVTGAGKAFSSGLDLNVLGALAASSTAEQMRTLIRRWQETFNRLENVPQVTIAAINGVCLGAGVELMLACDFRIASSRTQFALPEVKFAMVPDLGGITRLTRMVGPAWAKEVILRGRNVSAMEALRIGMVNRVADPGDMPGIARNWAQQFLKLPPTTMTLAKRLINATYDSQLAQALQAAEYAQLELWASDEFRGALAALQQEPAEEVFPEGGA